MEGRCGVVGGDVIGWLKEIEIKGDRLMVTFLYIIITSSFSPAPILIRDTTFFRAEEGRTSLRFPEVRFANKLRA